MVRGSIIKWINDSNAWFTKNQLYVIHAGQGDGIPRSDGTLGAYIQSENQFAVLCDRNYTLLKVWNEDDWKMVEEKPSTYIPKRDAVSPIPLSRAFN